MRIISKFHDYYDGVVSHGIDPDLVFQRTQHHEERIPKEFRSILRKSYYDRVPRLGVWGDCREHRSRTKKFNIGAKEFVILFCGKLYRGIQMEFSGKEAIYCYSSEDVIEELKNRKMENFLDIFDPFYWGYGSYRARHTEATKALEEVFADNGSTRYRDVAIRLKLPILSMHPCSPKRTLLFSKTPDWYCLAAMTINPKLKDLMFFRVFDPYSAFQELSVFLGGIVPRDERAMENISDRDLAQEKGFNEYSFRKPPGEKKPRRRGKKK